MVDITSSHKQMFPLGMNSAMSSSDRSLPTNRMSRDVPGVCGTAALGEANSQSILTFFCQLIASIAVVSSSIVQQCDERISKDTMVAFSFGFVHEKQCAMEMAQHKFKKKMHCM